MARDLPQWIVTRAVARSKAAVPPGQVMTLPSRIKTSSVEASTFGNSA